LNPGRVERSLRPSHGPYRKSAKIVVVIKPPSDKIFEPRPTGVLS
jgi:hypothetical protein